MEGLSVVAQFPAVVDREEALLEVELGTVEDRSLRERKLSFGVVIEV